MRLYVKLLGGIISLEVEPEQTILDIKHMIKREEPEYYVMAQKLYDMVDGELIGLHNHQTVNQLGWRDQHEIVLLIQNNYYVPNIEDMKDILKIKLLGRERLGDMTSLIERRMGLVKKEQYTFPLQTAKIDITSDWLRIERFYPNLADIRVNHSNVSELPIRDGIFITGRFYHLFVDDRPVHLPTGRNEFRKGYRFKILIRLLPPFSIKITNPSQEEKHLIELIESENCKLITLDYLNIVPREDRINYLEFTGRKREGSKRSIKKYIRRSLRKELRKLMK